MNKININRLWYYFRLGHANYLAFSLQITNTLLLIYNFGLNQYFDNIYLVSILLASIYLPSAIIFGRLHVTRQFKTEIDIGNEYNQTLKDILKELRDKKQKE